MWRTILAALVVTGATAWAAGPPDAAALDRFRDIASARRDDSRALRLWDAGRQRESAALFLAGLKRRQALYPKATHPRGHPDLMASYGVLAAIARTSGQYPAALDFQRSATELLDAMHAGRDHRELADALLLLGWLHAALDQNEKARPALVRALAMRERLHGGRDSAEVALASNHLAVSLEKLGDYVGAERHFRRSLEMKTRLLGDRDHDEIAMALNNLGFLLHSVGEFAKAEPLYRRALEMRLRLYAGKDHGDVAVALNNLGSLHKSRGEHAEAERLLRRAAEMLGRLHAGDHLDLASALRNHAECLQLSGADAKAEALYRRALKMTENLHGGRDHEDVRLGLNSLGVLHESRGEYAEAEPLFRRSLAMAERLSGARADHSVANALSNLAHLHASRGEPEKAEPLYRRALGIFDAMAASRPDGGNFAAILPLCRDAYLATTAKLGGTDSYDAVWSSKANLTRAAERDHLAVTAAATSPRAAALWDGILALRRERERLLLATADPAAAPRRTDRLGAIEAEIRTTMETLRPLLPAVTRLEALAASKAADLRKALPAETAFVDIVRYVANEGRKPAKQVPRYAAFVLTRAGVTRLEIGDAGPIDRAGRRWRESLTLGPAGDDFEAKYAAEAYRLVWAPLLKHLPAKASAVFVAPDGTLNGIPWAALRDGAGKILIEHHAVAVVPHGPFLLDRLTAGRRSTEKSPTLLAMGGVSYGDKPRAHESHWASRSPVRADRLGVWADLKGAAGELDRVTALAKGRRVIVRRGGEADAPGLLADLPKAETAHLATHGFFADAAFRSWMNMDPKLFERLGTERATHGARNPLVLSGLVCAGANLADTPNRGIVTADAVVGLDLRKMNLAVLSACETGLGEVAGGEGVLGLTRAFHIAGARNVVASLWKVPDEPTAALMNLFYANHWDSDNPVSPLEALRRAQLAVYRNPGLVGGWAKERGFGATATAGPKRPAVPAAKAGAKTSPARAWAAFVLSGPGD